MCHGEIQTHFQGDKIEMKRTTTIKRKRVVCPQCHTERTIRINTKIRRFQARRYNCPNDECEFVGTAGQFDSWVDTFIAKEGTDE